MLRPLWILLLASATLRAEPRGDDPVYVLILDRSGSMLTEEPKPEGGTQTRWDRLQEQVSEFIAGRDVGSILKLIVFEPTQADPSPIKIQQEVLLDSPETIAAWAAIARRKAPWNPRWPLEKRGFGEPTNGTTPLYLSIRDAFDFAIEYSQDGRNRPIAICVFTDGENDYKDPSGKPSVSVAELRERCHRLEKLNENARYSFTLCRKEPMADPLAGCALSGKTQPPTPFIPASISPRQITLLNPRIAPTQEFELTLTELSAADLKLLEGTSFALEYVAEAGDPVQAKVVDSLAPLAGPQKIRIEIANAGQLSGDREYRGSIRVVPPQLKRHRIDGLDRPIAVLFQKGELPHIERIDPAGGAVFLVNEPVNCRVWTLQDAEVEWDFGDGGKGSGHTASTAFAAPGEQTIKVTVRDRHGQTAAGTTNVRIIDAGLTLQPPRGAVFERCPVEIAAQSFGGVTDVTWRINGQTIDGARQPSPESSVLGHSFPVAMRYSVRAVGRLGDRIIRSPELVIDARPVEPVIRPPTREIRYRKDAEFTLACDAPVEAVAWQFSDADGVTVAESRQSNVHRFSRFGSHKVSATLTLPGGEQVVTPELFVTVLHRPEVVRAEVNSSGRPAASLRRIKPGSVVELVAQPDGDFDDFHWLIRTPAGRERKLPLGEKSFVLDELGRYDVYAMLTGPALGCDCAKSEPPHFVLMARNPAAHWITFVGCSLLAMLLLFIIYLTLGNGPTKWRLAVAGDLESLDRKTLGRPITSYWSRLKKTAMLPVGKFVAETYFQADPGIKEKLVLSKVRSANARGGLGLDVPAANQRFKPLGGTLDAQTYELTFPDRKRDDTADAASTADTGDKTVFLRLITPSKIPAWDVLVFALSVILISSLMAAVYWAVENYTGI